MTSLKRAQDDIEAQQKLLDDDSLVSQELSQLNPMNSPLSLSPPPSMQYFSYSQDNIDNQVPIYPHPTGTLYYFLQFSIFQICFFKITKTTWHSKFHIICVSYDHTQIISNRYA